jgi:hypothetical protein
MKTIKKDELFHNLGGFLKSKGIELNDGSYTTRIQQSCNLLSDAINATQKTVKQTKVHVDTALDKLRQTIHEHTAPQPPRTASAAGPSNKSSAAAGKQSAKPTAKSSTTKTKSRRQK